MADGGQYVTQKVVGTLGNVVKPLGPLKQIVDATGGAVSNVMGSTSRLLGKKVEPPNEVLFLYSRPLKHLGTSMVYQKAVRTVIGYALSNVILHKDEMKKGDEKSLELKNMPVLQSVVDNLEKAGASDDDIDDIINVLGRNGQHDLPSQIKPKVCSA